MPYDAVMITWKLLISHIEQNDPVIHTFQGCEDTFECK